MTSMPRRFSHSSDPTLGGNSPMALLFNRLARSSRLLGFSPGTCGRPPGLAARELDCDIAEGVFIVRFSGSTGPRTGRDRTLGSGRLGMLGTCLRRAVEVHRCPRGL